MIRPRRPRPAGLKKKASRAKTKPTIVPTGSRHDDHYRVVVRGRPVLLSCGCLIALVDLAHARIQTNSGFVRFPRSAIHRLRKSLGKAGKDLIETGSGTEYRLTIPKETIGESVGVTACFFELVELGVIGKTQADVLRTTCRRCTA